MNVLDHQWNRDESASPATAGFAMDCLIVPNRLTVVTAKVLDIAATQLVIAYTTRRF